MISSISTHLAAYTAPRSANETTSQSADTRVGQSKAELTAEQLEQVQKLADTDRKVRAHESAHLAAAGGIAIGGASFGYESGPDGKRYAVSGDVQIAVSEGKTPEETISRAEQVRRAALAPADPSAQDQKVAAEASQMAAAARMEQAKRAIQSSYGGAAAKGSLVDAQA